MTKPTFTLAEAVVEPEMCADVDAEAPVVEGPGSAVASEPVFELGPAVALREVSASLVGAGAFVASEACADMDEVEQDVEGELETVGAGAFAYVAWTDVDPAAEAQVDLMAIVEQTVEEQTDDPNFGLLVDVYDAPALGDGAAVLLETGLTGHWGDFVKAAVDFVVAIAGPVEHTAG